MWLFLAGAYTIVFGDDMNDRIKELFEQAGTDVSGKWMSVDNAEKFAELIVRACVRSCVADIADPRDSAELKCAKKIKEYFGV